MDVLATNLAANPAAITAVRPVASRALPDYAERMSRFDELAAAILDTGGKVSEAQQVQAYQALSTMSVTGRLIGLDDERRKTFDRATFDSDIGRRAENLSRGFVQAVNGAAQAGGAAAALKAALANVDSLSASDQNVLFRTGLSTADRTGAAPYADIQAWRDNTNAQLKVVSFMKDAGVIGANGAVDQGAAQVKAAADPRFAAALKLSLRRDNNSVSWTQAVLQLFGSERAPDRVDLSLEARRAMQPASDAPPAAPAPPAYRRGSIASLKA